MDWRDEGIIIGTRRHGETSAIVELITRDHGRHLGLVQGGRSHKMQPLLQTGNRVSAEWRARLDEHLGNYTLEPITFEAAKLIESRLALNGVQLIAAHLRLLPERDPHPQLYEILCVVMACFDNPALAGELIARFEIKLLEELGFGLDLEQCAATGRRDELIWVSPKSGRAVCREAGAPYADRLLGLPAFLRASPGSGASSKEFDTAWKLAGFFLNRDVYGPRGIEPPDARAAFALALSKSVAANSTYESGQEPN
jgi:DNA repair protein RecO (recombination protein O)